jgi:hypothetical protein
VLLWCRNVLYGKESWGTIAGENAIWKMMDLKIDEKIKRTKSNAGKPLLCKELLNMVSDP